MKSQILSWLYTRGILIRLVKIDLPVDLGIGKMIQSIRRIWRKI